MNKVAIGVLTGVWLLAVPLSVNADFWKGLSNVVKETLGSASPTEPSQGGSKETNKQKVASASPQDILYSSLGDAQNYGKYRVIFTPEKIQAIVASVDEGRTIDVNLYSLLVLTALYGREIPGIVGLTLETLGALQALVTGSSQNENVALLIKLLLMQVASENGIDLAAMKVLNDARNINQPQLAEYKEIKNNPNWEIENTYKAAFHVLGYDPKTIVKYVSKIDGKEFVFQSRGDDWVLVNDGINTGTYNYSTKTIPHFILDMAPWMLWGIGAEDRLTPDQRLSVARAQLLPYAAGTINKLTEPLVSSGKDRLNHAAQRILASAAATSSALKENASTVGAALGDISAVKASLQKNHPQTYGFIEGYSFADALSKETQLKIAYILSRLAESPKVSEVITKRLHLSTQEFVKFSIERSIASSLKSAKALAAGTAASIGEDLLVSAAAAVATDALFLIEPMDSVASNIEKPLRTVIEASLVEMYYIQMALQDPTVIVARVFDRYNQVREIVASSRVLAGTQDRGILAAAITVDTAAYLVVRYPSEKSRQIAEASLADTKKLIPDIVGKDDADAVWKILLLGHQAMKANYMGDTQARDKALAEINRLGRTSGNIRPWSSIIRTIDWLTAAANWGEDAPQRAAKIVLGATSLASDGKIEIPIIEAAAGSSVTMLEKGVVREQVPIAPKQTEVDPRTVDGYQLADNCDEFRIGACMVCNPLKSGLFRAEGNGDSAYRYEWSGQCGKDGGRPPDTEFDRILKIISDNLPNWGLQIISFSRDQDYPADISRYMVYKLVVKGSLDDLDNWQTSNASVPPIVGIGLGGDATEISSLIKAENVPQAIAELGKTIHLAEVYLDYSKFGVVDGPGTFKAYRNDKVYRDDIDYFELITGKESGVTFEKGKPVVQLPKSSFSVHLSSGKDRSSVGTCPSARGLRVWVITDPKLALHTDIVPKALINAAHEQVLKQCPGLNNTQHETTIMPTDAVDHFGGIDKMLARWVSGGYRHPKSISCKGRKLAASRSCDFSYWNSAQLQHTREMRARYFTRKQEQERLQREQQQAEQRRAIETKKERINALRLAAEKVWTAKWEKALTSDEPWENLTDLLRFNKAATIARLSKGHAVKLEYKGKDVEYAQGKSLLKDHQPGTDIYEGIPEGPGSWDQWFDKVNKVSTARPSFTVSCQVNPEELLGLKEDHKYVFFGTLKGVIDSQYASRVELNCKRTREALNK